MNFHGVALLYLCHNWLVLFKKAKLKIYGNMTEFKNFTQL
jgi:hypothetical protein